MKRRNSCFLVLLPRPKSWCVAERLRTRAEYGQATNHHQIDLHDLEFTTLRNITPLIISLPRWNFPLRVIQYSGTLHTYDAHFHSHSRRRTSRRSLTKRIWTICRKQRYRGKSNQGIRAATPRPTIFRHYSHTLSVHASFLSSTQYSTTCPTVQQ